MRISPNCLNYEKHHMLCDRDRDFSTTRLNSTSVHGLRVRDLHAYTWIYLCAHTFLDRPVWIDS